MSNVWYDTKKFPNVRYCGECRKKVGTNKGVFDFVICPYCGSHNKATEIVTKEYLLLSK